MPGVLNKGVARFNLEICARKSSRNGRSALGHGAMTPEGGGGFHRDAALVMEEALFYWKLSMRISAARQVPASLWP